MSGRRFDLIAIGRAAVDLYGEQIGGRLEDMASFAKYLGGCPANICVGAARLGLKPAMLTRVGEEHMGRFVRETLSAEGVDVGHVRTDPQRLTALVILGIRDRDSFPLIFYRQDCADMAVSPEDFDAAFIASAEALLVTGTHFSTAGTDTTCRTAMRYARAAGTRIVLDIDYRPVLWGLTGHGHGERRFVAAETVSRHLQSIVPDCDLIVGTEEEIHIAGGETDTLAAARKLRTLSDATIVVKRGPQGCVVFAGAIPFRIEDGLLGPGFPVEVFNVLGAGDGFMAGLLRGWLRGESWKTACRYANACGALVVARHGCAPAMPSWTELSDFLERAGEIRDPHADARLAELHRVTAGRRDWPEICALAFDHRRQFEDLAERHGKDIDAIVAFKGIVCDAALEVQDPAAGAIVDDRFGRAALDRLTGGGRWLARPIELPGAVPLAFEGGPDATATLRTWPAEHVVKCLVHCHPDDPADLRAAQESRVMQAFAACRATGHELLLEIVPPGGRGDGIASLPRSLWRFYTLGVRPDWWKLPPHPDPDHWRALGEAIRGNDPHCRGMLILGVDADEQALAASFAAAGCEPLVRGFAIGRQIFWSHAEDWFAGRISDEAARRNIAQAYARMISTWRGRAGRTD